ncbi:MAG TPA: ABC transporter permease subunit [Actinomycetota bacterium]|nr:ABC transporter permease subunit [Actinomycetota bacterium]
MTGLVLSELRRMWSRRLLRMMLLGAALLTVLIGIIVYFNSGRNQNDVEQQMSVQHQQAMDSCLRGEFGGPTTRLEGEELELVCNDIVGNFGNVDTRFHYRQMPEIWLGMSPLLAILALAVGASFVGADWQKGTMTTALTWEPRRIRLLGAKFFTVAASAFVLTIVIEGFMAVAMLPAAAFHGTFLGTNGAWMADLAETALRTGAIGALAAVVGCALATLGRNTAAALAVAFVYFAVVESLIRGLRPKWTPWLLSDNVAQFLSGSSPDPVIAARTTLEVVLVLVGYCALFIAAAMAFFKRRDIT